MVEKQAPPGRKRAADERFRRAIAGKEKLRARGLQRPVHILWFGLGISGIIGWAVAIPTLLGVVAGRWIDERWPGQYSWTLMLLLAGIIFGCLNAWYWVQKAGRRIRQD